MKNEEKIEHFKFPHSTQVPEKMLTRAVSAKPQISKHWKFLCVATLCLKFPLDTTLTLAYALLRFRHKIHLVRVRSTSWSGFKYLFWWQQSQMEIIHLFRKNRWFWWPEKWLETSAGL